MPKVAVFYDEKVLEDKDILSLKSTLVSELEKVEGLEVVELRTDLATPPAEAVREYGLVVFCGYSLNLLSILFSTLSQGVPVLLYDLPGESVERELNALLFSGVDSQRLPPSTLSQITHSWTYRDIVGICKQMAKNAPPQGSPADLDRARSVEDTGKASSRKRTSPDATKSEGRRGSST